MTAAALLADLRRDGVEFESDGVRLRWRPASSVSASRAGLILDRKAELIDLMSAAAVLADLRHDRIEIETDGVRLRWRPAVSEPRVRLIREHKPEIILLLTMPGLDERRRCVTCPRYLNGLGQCWSCCDRRCHCGRQTGSAFIELCQLCARTENQAAQAAREEGDLS